MDKILITRKQRLRFISFEGIDYSGKSTQIEYLKNYLEQKGFKVNILREPGGTQISEMIRSILLDKNHSKMHERCEILLYSAARVQLMTEKIIPLLQENEFVIADRFADSTTAYQGYGRGLDLDLVNQINHFATLDIMPGITFYMKINPEEAFQRRKDSGRDPDRLESAGKSFYMNIYKGYRKMAEEQPDRIFVLDATQVREQIHRQIINKVEKLVFGETV